MEKICCKCGKKLSGTVLKNLVMLDKFLNIVLADKKISPPLLCPDCWPLDEDSVPDGWGVKEWRDTLAIASGYSLAWLLNDRHSREMMEDPLILSQLVFANLLNTVDDQTLSAAMKKARASHAELSRKINAPSDWEIYFAKIKERWLMFRDNWQKVLDITKLPSLMKFIKDKIVLAAEFYLLKRKANKLIQAGALKEALSVIDDFMDYYYSKYARLDVSMEQLDNWSSKVRGELCFILGEHRKAEWLLELAVDHAETLNDQINFQRMVILNYIAPDQLRRAAFCLDDLLEIDPDLDISDILAAFKQKNYIPPRFRTNNDEEEYEKSRPRLTPEQEAAIRNYDKTELKIISRLDDRSIQELMKDCSFEDTILLIKLLDDAAFEEKIYKNMSKRGAFMMKKDMECDFDRPITLDEYTPVMERVIAVFHRFVEEGKILLPLTPEEKSAIDAHRSEITRKLMELDDDVIKNVVAQSSSLDITGMIKFVDSPAFTERIYKNVSPRAAEMIKEDVEYDALPMRLKEYMEVFNRFMEAAKK